MTDLGPLIRAGLSDRAIARETGIERRQVARWRAAHGYAPWRAPVPEHGTRARWTADELAIALDLSYSAAEAARILSRSKSAVEHQRARRKAELRASGPMPRGRRAAGR